jgi:hypothetical protein
MQGYTDPKGLLPAVQWETRKAFIELSRRFLEQTGHVLRVRSGRRTCAEQAYQVIHGFSHASGCRSWHVLARAVDADPIRAETGAVIADSRVYAKAGVLWEQMGGVWGGRFLIGGYPDEGHFEWHPGMSISEICPNPADCEQVSSAIVTRAPRTLVWAIAGFGVVLGIAAWRNPDWLDSLGLRRGSSILRAH